MYKIILMCFMSLALLSSNAYAKNTRWCMYNNFQYKSSDNLYKTVSVEETGKKCEKKFKIKIHQRRDYNPFSPYYTTNINPKHGIPECAFPVRVCAKHLCTTINEIGSYIIEYKDGIKALKKDDVTKPNCK